MHLKMGLFHPTSFRNSKWFYEHIFDRNWQACILQEHIRNRNSQYALARDAIWRYGLEGIVSHLHSVDHSKACSTKKTKMWKTFPCIPNLRRNMVQIPQGRNLQSIRFSCYFKAGMWNTTFRTRSRELGTKGLGSMWIIMPATHDLGIYTWQSKELSWPQCHCNSSDMYIIHTRGKEICDSSLEKRTKWCGKTKCTSAECTIDRPGTPAERSASRVKCATYFWGFSMFE